MLGTIYNWCSSRPRNRILLEPTIPCYLQQEVELTIFFWDASIPPPREDKSYPSLFQREGMFYIIFIFAFDGIGGGMEWKGPISSKLLFDYLGGTLFNSSSIRCALIHRRREVQYQSFNFRTNFVYLSNLIMSMVVEILRWYWYHSNNSYSR